MSSKPPADLKRPLGVRFKDELLLQRALTHGSYLNEHPEDTGADYERLEFLGDAFLGWVVADELFRRHASFSEGDLTRARASLVKGATLAEIARELDVGRYLRIGSGEEATGGRNRRSTLAAVVEALIGAVLLDRGETQARKLVLRWLGPRIDELDPTGTPRDAKSQLQEACQRTGLPLPQYELLSESGPAHEKHFVVRVLIEGEERGTGEGRKKGDAEQAAAARALAAMPARD